MLAQTKMLGVGEASSDKFAHPIHLFDSIFLICCLFVTGIQLITKELKIFKVFWGRNP